MSKAALKSPFPYFGGKSRVASLVWERFGDVPNYIEPFAGSAAMLLRRPHAPRIETINDADCMVANFWRATQVDPEAVASYADGPVNEADLHARHRWLVLSPEAKAFRERMKTDPAYFDAKIAGWWCWGLCCWIGGGWCNSSADDRWVEGRTANGDCEERKPTTTFNMGVHAASSRKGKLQLTGGSPGDRKHCGKGVNGKLPEHEWQQRPRLEGQGLHQKLPDISGHSGGSGRGVHQVSGPRQQLPDLAGEGNGFGTGVMRQPDGRPKDSIDWSDGACGDRRNWLIEWFGRIRDRTRNVRVCCGDWLRVCDSHSVTTRLGITAVFFDPPYGDAADRDMNLYAVECGKAAGKVRAYCLDRGADPLMRIALCGYAGEGHEVLDAAGWDCVPWRAHGGYGNRSEKGRANAGRERIWFSPNCVRPADDLFTRAPLSDALTL